MTTDINLYLRDLFADLGTGHRTVDLSDPFARRQLADEVSAAIEAMVSDPDWW